MAFVKAEILYRNPLGNAFKNYVQGKKLRFIPRMEVEEIFWHVVESMAK